MRAAAMVAPLLLAGCDAGDGEAGANTHSAERRVHDQGGRILDLAGVLAADEERALARKLRDGQQADGRAVLVVLIEPAGQSSLEHLGWAVGTPGQHGPILLLVDPAQRQVRLEGNLQPDAKGRVAAAMRPELQTRRYGAAIDAGLTELERIAP